MAKRIAINGFGRIGRLVFRRILQDEKLWDKQFEIVAINDLTNAKTLAHLLKYDSAQGPLCECSYKISSDDKHIIVNGKKIPVFAERDPEALPWKEYKIDIVVESTGFFCSEEGAEKHIKAGAKKVAISAPAKGDIKTIVYGVNDDTITKTDKIISGASCTTNCLAPMAKAIDDAFGIESGLMTTIHGYTGDQRIVDAPHSDLRRARAAAVNIVPTSTGAAKAIGLVLPKLKGKLDGFALRVPVVTGSIVDLTFKVKKAKVDVEAINKAVKDFAKKSKAIAYLTDPVVSCDIVGATYGSLFDPALTKEIDSKEGKLFKVISWYDNEMSYVSQFVRTLEVFSKK